MSRASERAYDHIRGMILRGELSPGTQLREEHLAELCSVSRTPVREALQRLEVEAFIRRSESQRSFVADWSLDDIAEAFELRAMLESHAAKRAATRINAHQLAALRRHSAELNHAISADVADIGVFLEQNRQFHAIIIEAAASDRLAAMLASIVEQAIVWRTARQYDRENLARSHNEHEELIAAFDRRDGEWAGAIMASHIRRAFHAYADAHSSAHDKRT